MAEQKKFATPGGLVNRQTFIEYLRRCAEDWDKVADGSFYGIKRAKIDADAQLQASRVRSMADRLESAGEEEAGYITTFGRIERSDDKPATILAVRTALGAGGDDHPYHEGGLRAVQEWELRLRLLRAPAT